MSLAPIAFFAYNRPNHMKRALQSLADNGLAKDSELFIFIDGPKESDVSSPITEVGTIAASRKWCGTVHIIERDKNVGLSQSIISGVTRLCEKQGKAIILEDDLVVSEHFLRYMNDALNRYETDTDVYQISGYQFPVDIPCTEDTFFARMGTSWGWGTWQRAWKEFDHSAAGYTTLRQNRTLRDRFDMDGAYPFFSMLEEWRNGNNDSWAVRFYLHMFLRNGLALHPKRSLVSNLGHDGSGTHCAEGDREAPPGPSRLLPESYPPRKEENQRAYEAIRHWLQKQRPETLSLSARIKNFFNCYQ